MHSISVFSNARAGNMAMMPSATAATLYTRGATTTHPMWRDPKIDAADWDPTKDEIVWPKESRGWGAVGRERRARMNFERAPLVNAERTYAAPRAPATFNHAPLAELQCASGRLNWNTPFAFLDPLDPINVAIRAGQEARRAAAKARKELRDRKTRREMDELHTESFNPFNPINMAAQAAVEAYLAKTGATLDFIAFAACIPAESSYDLEDEDLLDVPTDSGPLPNGATAGMEPRTPSPKAQDASASSSASPESDYRSDSTKSSWGSLASLSPPQEMHHEPCCDACTLPSYLAGPANKGDLGQESRLQEYRGAEDMFRPAFSAGVEVLDED
ncbi:hypothetical protein FKP32DRAFT_560391 [Trametes sanguinea]|nr:hypothetical protein FKP32DRAFT_560391 [Trametes sanguinea]